MDDDPGSMQNSKVLWLPLLKTKEAKINYLYLSDK